MAAPAPTVFDTISTIAADQAGYVSLRQLSGAGVSRQALYHHESAGRLARVACGYYRLTMLRDAKARHLLPADFDAYLLNRLNRRQLEIEL